MKAAVVRDNCDGYVDIKDVELRDLKYGEALVKWNIVVYVTQIYIAAGDLVKFPVVLLATKVSVK